MAEEERDDELEEVEGNAEPDDDELSDLEDESDEDDEPEDDEGVVDSTEPSKAPSAPEGQLPGDAELLAEEQPAAQPTSTAAPLPVDPIAQLAAHFRVSPEEIASRLFGRPESAPAQPLPAEEEEDADAPVTRAEMRRTLERERVRMRDEAVREAEQRVSARMTNADIHRMIDVELDQYSASQRVIGSKRNEARDDIKGSVLGELGQMPGWGSDATGNIKRVVQKKLRAMLAAAGRLPTPQVARKATRREAGEVQPSKTPGAVGRAEGDEDEDNLVSRRGAAKRRSIIMKMIPFRKKRAG